MNACELEMFARIKEWALTLNNGDQNYKTAIFIARDYSELEPILSHLIGEIGWVNLAGLAGIMHQGTCEKHMGEPAKKDPRKCCDEDKKCCPTDEIKSFYKARTADEIESFCRTRKNPEESKDMQRGQTYTRGD